MKWLCQMSFNCSSVQVLFQPGSESKAKTNTTKKETQQCSSYLENSELLCLRKSPAARCTKQLNRESFTDSLKTFVTVPTETETLQHIADGEN